jgi:hypothetical protein
MTLPWVTSSAFPDCCSSTTQRVLHHRSTRRRTDPCLTNDTMRCLVRRSSDVRARTARFSSSCDIAKRDRIAQMKHSKNEAEDLHCCDGAPAATESRKATDTPRTSRSPTMSRGITFRVVCHDPLLLKSTSQGQSRFLSAQGGCSIARSRGLLGRSEVFSNAPRTQATSR